jgi:hypothetical protein
VSTTLIGNDQIPKSVLQTQMNRLRKTQQQNQYQNIDYYNAKFKAIKTHSRNTENIKDKINVLPSQDEHQRPQSSDSVKVVD